MRTIKVSTYVRNVMQQAIQESDMGEGMGLYDTRTWQDEYSTVVIDNPGRVIVYTGTYGRWELTLEIIKLMDLRYSRKTKGDVRPVDDTAHAYKDEIVSTN